MARITVEDCLKKIDSQYDLVLLAKERTTQLNAGGAALVPQENDKNTVISLREIGEGKISIKTLEDAAINKLREQQEETTVLEDLEDDYEDNFDKIYKGEISKSGTAILPSKRIRRMPTKVNLDFKGLDNEKDDKNKKTKQQLETETKQQLETETKQQLETETKQQLETETKQQLETETLPADNKSEQ